MAFIPTAQEARTNGLIKDWKEKDLLSGEALKDTENFLIKNMKELQNWVFATRKRFTLSSSEPTEKSDFDLWFNGKILTQYIDSEWKQIVLKSDLQMMVSDISELKTKVDKIPTKISQLENDNLFVQADVPTDDVRVGAEWFDSDNKTWNKAFLNENDEIEWMEL